MAQRRDGAQADAAVTDSAPTRLGSLGPAGDSWGLETGRKLGEGNHSLSVFMLS
jgi:hypothetical protein